MRQTYLDNQHCQTYHKTEMMQCLEFQQFSKEFTHSVENIGSDIPEDQVVDLFDVDQFEFFHIYKKVLLLKVLI